ncbi:hypothetical protein B0H15DRAFT_436751 [Mycena belliarum]|uniref:LOV domain-containing protein n=1 Tax=Mycena belliarum TaxID=1033014 RepID=A0AAD6XNS4_9AGAR|nr:hypothetical protein B0H15DRAFT_436751 [Mycena belliae]
MHTDSPNSTTPEPDVRPLSPLSDTLDTSSTLAPSIPESLASNPPERKLTIRVPVEYTPPTPPPSASLPAIPPRSTPVSKRASAPVFSSSAGRAFTLDPPALSTGPALAHVQEGGVVKAFRPVTLTAPDTVLPKTILVAGINFPPATRKPSPAVQDTLGPQQGTELQCAPALVPAPRPPPTPAGLNPRRQSRSAPSQPPRQQQQTLQPPANPRIRKSPSLNNAPSDVSLIDFESSAEEEEEDDEGAPPSPQSLSQTPSIPEEESTPTRTHTPVQHAHPLRKAASSGAAAEVDPELSRWAPEPEHFPTQSIAVPYTGNPPPPPVSSRAWAMRSRSSVGSRERESSITGSMGTDRWRGGGGKHATMMGLSSLGAADAVQRDMDFTMRALMSPDMFTRMLMDPLTRQRFREFLMVDGNTAELDCWTDAQFLAQAVDQLQANASAFRNLYMTPGGPTYIDLNPATRRELHGVLQRILGVDTSLGSAQHRLLESLYHDQFQRFVKHKIIQETHVTLGSANLAAAEGREGLGDAFVLTNPRLPDHPIVLVSDGFVDVTGYPKTQIIGRNCRFLQGPGTPPESVQRIRDGLNSGKGCTELLLNYRRDGDPFYCLLCIIPVRDASGAIVYFIGGQTNVTGLLSTDRGLGLHSTTSGEPQPMQMSPALAALREQAGLLLLRPAPADQVRAAGSVRSSGRGGGGGGGTGSGFFRGLFARGASVGVVAGRPDGKQFISGAEGVLNGAGSGGLQDQYALFQNTYNKILIFKFKKREITFVSPQMLTYLGLPTRTQRDLVASTLIRNDIATLLTGGDERAETRRVRDELKDAVRRGVPCSLHCGVKVPGKGLLTRNDSTRHKFGMMHMTPIKDGDNVAVAFVAIFG